MASSYMALLEHSLSQEEVSDPEIWIDVERLLILLDGRIVLASEIEVSVRDRADDERERIKLPCTLGMHLGFVEPPQCR